MIETYPSVCCRVRLIATCPEETKPALVLELEVLGAKELAPGFRAVSFEADDALFYELHLKLRTASRILRVIKEVPCLLYTSPSPRDGLLSRMPSSA